MPNSDYILRSNVMKVIRYYKNCREENYVPSINDIHLTERQLLEQAINNIPATDVEPVRHGYNVKWDYPTLFECSLCGWECFDTVPGDTDTYQYCPNCGAKMDAEPPEEEKDD